MFVCLGQKGLAYEDRIRSFRGVSDLKKHFHRKHLRHYKDGQPIECCLCSVTVDGPTGLQYHAASVYGTRT
jgi:hypothetical protein